MGGIFVLADQELRRITVSSVGVNGDRLYHPVAELWQQLEVRLDLSLLDWSSHFRVERAELF